MLGFILNARIPTGIKQHPREAFMCFFQIVFQAFYDVSVGQGAWCMRQGRLPARASAHCIVQWKEVIRR